MPNDNDLTPEQIAELKTDPRYGKLRALVGGVLDDIIAMKKNNKGSKKQAKKENAVEEEEQGNFFDDIFGD